MVGAFYEIAEKLFVAAKAEFKIEKTHGAEVTLNAMTGQIHIQIHDDEKKEWRRAHLPMDRVNLNAKDFSNAFTQIKINLYPTNLFIEFTDLDGKKNTIVNNG